MRPDEIRTIIAGYHWFTDWGRDTMISFEGLTLTQSHTEAGWILRTFAITYATACCQICSRKDRIKKKGLYHTPTRHFGFSRPGKTSLR